MSKDISLTKVLKALSDQKTQKLFAVIIRAESAKSQPLIGDLGLTRRQYYSRINDLLKTGLIRRHGGKYRVSSFGKVIHSLQKTAERTASSYWKLEAIDRIKMSDNSKLTEADRMKIIDILLDDVEIKEIYLHQDIFSNGSRSQENDREHELLLTRTK